MKALVPVLVVGGGVLAVLGYGAYRSTQPSAKETASHAAIVRDRSDSTTSGCPAIGGLAGECLRSGQTGRFSTIIALATGDRRSNDEPVEFARLSQVRWSSVRDGRSSADRRDAALIAELVSRCERSGTTDRSPIYLAIRRALEELRALGCREENRCILHVQSDLSENAEPGLRKALLGDKDAFLPAPIENRGIRVHVCGTAETSGPTDGKGKVVSERRTRGARRADITPDVWRKVFTAPELVTFEPHCPKVAPVGGQEPKVLMAR